MKHAIIQQIEKITDATLHPAPERSGDRLTSVMPYKKNMPKYALDANGQTILGLNLANIGLTDEKWRKIRKLKDLADHLQLLNLSDNDLTVFEFPGGKALRKIQALNLEGNKLKEFLLPDSMPDLKELNLEENPLETPPEEILRQGKAAVLRYLRELVTSGVKEIFEVKMLIVGEGGTGKTTLWNLLQNPDHPVPDLGQKSTVGIQIKEGWSFTHLDRPQDDFLVNLWDFGGQEIQYMTHQFFLTRRSFYVLLADGRREVANFPYWFKVIDLLGCEEEEQSEKLPVLVVLNEKGNPIAKIPYEQSTIKDDFPKLEVVRREVDFANKRDGRIRALRHAMKDILCRNMSHLPLRFPVSWNEVRQEIYRLRQTKNHIDFGTYRAICLDIGITDEVAMTDLSQLLHDLGVILHYQDDLQLKNFIVLNPEWAVKAVMKCCDMTRLRRIRDVLIKNYCRRSGMDKGIPLLSKVIY